MPRAKALDEVNRFLRDFRTGDVHPMDPELLDVLYDLKLATGSGGTYEVISAYRSPRTNEMLRRQGRGVATKSMHLQGRAIDVRLTDLTQPVGPQPLVVETTALMDATLDEGYSAALSASGGAGGYSWDTVPGQGSGDPTGLPPGLVLGAHGMLSETPTALGDYEFTVRVTDAEDGTADWGEANQAKFLRKSADARKPCGATTVLR